MTTNHIRAVTFRPVAPGSGPGSGDDGVGGHALFIALEVGEPSQLVSFLEEVVTRFKAERMEGPPDVRFMLITLAGLVSAGDFAQAWQTSIANDPAARALLGTLHQADVMQGDPQGHMIGQVSLLASGANDFAKDHAALTVSRDVGLIR